MRTQPTRAAMLYPRARREWLQLQSFGSLAKARLATAVPSRHLVASEQLRLWGPDGRTTDGNARADGPRRLSSRPYPT